MELFAFGDIPHRVTLRTACEHQQTVGPLHPFPCGLSAQGGVRVVAGAGGKDPALEVVVLLPSPQLPQEDKEEGQLCLDISGAPAKQLMEWGRWGGPGLGGHDPAAITPAVPRGQGRRSAVFGHIRSTSKGARGGKNGELAEQVGGG